MILSIKNLKINFIKKKPFYIFSINNFIDDNFYNSLFKSIPNYKNFTSIEAKNIDKKISLDSRNILVYDKYFKGVESIQAILDFFNSHEAKNFFINKFKFIYIKSLLLSIWVTIAFVEKDMKFRTRISHLKRNILRLIKSLPIVLNNLELETKIEYSYILNEGLIVPHTDSKSKFISLMLYFPKLSNENKMKKLENNLGTIFYSSKISNSVNQHLHEEKLDNFIKNSQIISKLPFDSKNLYGFIRSPFSWHAVEKVDIDKDYYRFSININYHTLF